MLNCPKCNQRLSGKLKACPECGADQPPLLRVGAYEILECVADSRTASIFRARKGETGEMVCLRLYDGDVAITSDQEQTLRERFAALRELPADRFVHTLDFGHDDATGRWYRVTPWLPNVIAWGDLKSEALYRNRERKRQWLDLALDLAESFAELHSIGRVIPDFTLDDCLLYRAADGRLRVRLDATLASCLGPGSGREKVRGRHPDFAPDRSLSERSDVWTLGSILVSMLKGTSEIADYAKAMDEINGERRPVAVHPELGSLLRQMVDADPAARPRGMKEIAKRLCGFGPGEIGEWCALERDPWKHSLLIRRVAVVAVIAVAASLVVASIMFHHQTKKTESALQSQIRAVDSEGRAEAVFDRYGRSVAFVLTDAWLEIAGQRISLGNSIGTAFLVSDDGYLLSNRHVVAPWLSGEFAKTVQGALELVRLSGRHFRFGAEHWLWFDGEEAFRHPHVVLPEDAALADIYRLDTAYSTSGENPRLRIVGVMPVPADPAEYLASTLEDDVAVLKVVSPPDGLPPIPLRAGSPPSRGAGLMVLGYSRGRGAIPGTRALARATRGSASGTIWDVITTDADIQHGNSGGPVFDLDGYAVGIASALHRVDGRGETSMGRVLPIESARRFLEDMRAGLPAWNGLLVEALEPELVAARKAVAQGQWDIARKLASVDGVLFNPDVALEAAIYSMDRSGFTPQGRIALKHVTAMAPHFPFAALLRYWDGWRRGMPPDERPCRQELLNAEWWSPFEPYGRIAGLLDGLVEFEQAAGEAEYPIELAMMAWMAGTMAAREGDLEQAARLFNLALEHTPADDTLTRALVTASLWFECGKLPPTDLRPIFAGNLLLRFLPMEQAAKALLNGNWVKAAAAIDRHFETPRRESANTLGLGLLRAQLHGLLEGPDAERGALEAFRDHIRNDWYKQIADVLLGNADPNTVLTSVSGKRPETVTLAIALALRAEAQKDTARALHYYRTALDTGQTNWLEFQLARARRQALGRE